MRASAAAALAVAAVGMPSAALAVPAASEPTDFVAVGMPAAAAPAPAVSEPTDFRIIDQRVTESSGLARSRSHPHTVWTVNDSGDSARVFAVDTRSGRTVGVHTFDAPVHDVEALAVTRQGRMLVADIGDNTGSRDLVRVFWFDEPALRRTSGPWASWELRYPDGPHNAESLAVDPRTGRVYVVTKESGSTAGVYALPQEPSRQGVNRLKRVGPAPAIATDAVFLADGSALAVRTYTSLVLLDPRTWQVLSTTLLPLQPQGETIALAPERGGLLVGSEGRDSLVQEISIPQGAPRNTAPPTSTAKTSATSRTTATPSLGVPGPTPGVPAPTTRSHPAPPDAKPLGDHLAFSADPAEVAKGLGSSALLVALALAITWLVRRSRR